MVKKYESGVRAWDIQKNCPWDCIEIDFKHKRLRYNKDEHWIRFETQEILWIWKIPAQNSEPHQLCEKCSCHGRCEREKVAWVKNELSG